jgi:hypothetical protein
MTAEQFELSGPAASMLGVTGTTHTKDPSMLALRHTGQPPDESADRPRNPGGYTASKRRNGLGAFFDMDRNFEIGDRD